VVEGKYKLRKEAAGKCRTLLKQARANLAAEKAELLKKPKEERQAAERKMKVNGEVPVTKAESIGIASAYRSFEHDSALWHSYFRNPRRATQTTL